MNEDFGRKRRKKKGKLSTAAKVIIAIVLVIYAIVMFAIGFIVSKLYKLYMPILEIILGVLLIGAGVAIIILFTNNSEIVMSIMLVIVGLALIVASVFKIVGTIRAILKSKEEKEPDENVIDAPENFEVKEEEPKEETVQETESTEVTVIEETNE